MSARTDDEEERIKESQISTNIPQKYGSMLEKSPVALA
jgi:hypothetical protein